ncbi:hypothetical protein M9H77_24867 [Catharanthus roseus]|uniref:Uncharacterized protein n=1 Tax=Catharanthus roseus TaxID=4058 RepID=A0ACC0A641_CATRO|nr:hypothetical protein M9H77_24867 [Catharanthus roseus]
MSFKSMFGGLSCGSESNLRKRSERKGVLGRGRSHIAPESSPSFPCPSLQQSQWANLPPELLIDIIRRLESSETLWPARRDVVSCAAVCRSWREVTKEVVRTPEQCGLITFPMSLKQPGPRDYPIQCFIRRERATSTFCLYLGLSPALSGNASKLLLAAKKVRRATKTQFLISFTADDFSQANDNYAGKLRSNFLGTKFIIYDSQPPCDLLVHSSGQSHKKFSSKKVMPRLPVGKYNVASISYELNVLRTRGPRRMQCIMHEIPISAIQEGGSVPTPETFVYCPAQKLSSSSTLEDCNQEFNSTVDPALNIPNEEQEKVILQFGKIGKDIFTMDYRYPLSAFQAFAICLSSFDTKPACE